MVRLDINPERDQEVSLTLYRNQCILALGHEEEKSLPKDFRFYWRPFPPDQEEICLQRRTETDTSDIAFAISTKLSSSQRGRLRSSLVTRNQDIEPQRVVRWLPSNSVLRLIANVVKWLVSLVAIGRGIYNIPVTTHIFSLCYYSFYCMDLTWE